MIADVECENFPLTNFQVKSLLDSSCKNVQRDTNGTIAIRCMSSTEIQDLNAKYRDTNTPTNVLTFSYDDSEHDIALCMDVAKREALERNVNLIDYVALLLTHAFLHVLGMDHERSQEEDQKTLLLEKTILDQCGFIPISLSGI